MAFFNLMVFMFSASGWVAGWRSRRYDFRRQAGLLDGVRGVTSSRRQAGLLDDVRGVTIFGVRRCCWMAFAAFTTGQAFALDGYNITGWTGEGVVCFCFCHHTPGSMLRPFEGLRWPSPFVVDVVALSGAMLRAVVQHALRRLASSSSASGFILFHAGVNDASKVALDFEEHFRRSCDFAARAFSGPLSRFKVVCSLVSRTRIGDVNQRVRVANQLLREFAEGNGWHVISNDNIHFSDLSDDVHLNGSGVAKVFRNYLHFFKSM